MFGGSAKLRAIENELRVTKLKLSECEDERDDLKNLTLELQKVLSKLTTDLKVRENENDETVTSLSASFLSSIFTLSLISVSYVDEEHLPSFFFFETMT